MRCDSNQVAVVGTAATLESASIAGGTLRSAPGGRAGASEERADARGAHTATLAAVVRVLGLVDTDPAAAPGSSARRALISARAAVTDIARRVLARPAAADLVAGAP